ncbi:MAG TPA: hypothetical protein VME22_17465 [Solirubrobacteraceae bacterium]|nr:hypothetical protein [Solirubrobacteraceae bacterium]
MSSGDSAVDLELLAASLRADTSDLTAFVESLAAKLEEAVPSRTKVERRRSGMFGPKAVRRITVDLGNRRLELSHDGGAVQTSCSQLSGGIVLKREAFDADDWLAALSEALAAEAKRSETTRKALERLLTG